MQTQLLDVGKTWSETTGSRLEYGRCRGGLGGIG